jgi:hypothetical protein
MHNKKEFELYEQTYGPHFNEKYALKAVSKMENEDGSKGAYWDLQQTTSVAKQYNIDLNVSFNKYDWFVALNMVRSDYYKFIVNLTNSDNVKYFVELAKAWLNDKDITEGKMWHYFRYVMCPEVESKVYEDEYEDDDDYSYYGSRRNAPKVKRVQRREYDDDDDDEEEYYRTRMYRRGPRYISRY